LMAIETRLGCEAAVAMRLMAIEAGLLGVRDDGRVRALRIVMAVEALVPLAKEDIRRALAELERSHAEPCWIERRRAGRKLALEYMTTRAVVGRAFGAVVQADVRMAGVARVRAGHLEQTLLEAVAVFAAYAARNVLHVTRALAGEAPARANHDGPGRFRGAARCDGRSQDAQQRDQALEPDVAP